MFSIKDKADAAESVVLFDDDIAVRFDTSGGQIKVTSIKYRPDNGAGADYASFNVAAHPAKADQLLQVAKDVVKAAATRFNDLLSGDITPTVEETKLMTDDPIPSDTEPMVLDDSALP